MSKTEYQFTIRNFAAIGILEEFYDIYCSLQTEYKVLEANKVSYNNINAQLIKILRKCLNLFLEQYTYIFTDDFQRIYTSSFSIADLHLYDIKLNETGYLYSFISFSAFLKDCEQVISRILYKRKSYTDKSIQLETIWNELNTRVFDLAYHNIQNNKQIRQTTQPIYDLFVYKNLSSISCNLYNHTIKPSRIAVPLISNGKYILLPIHICEDCGKRFVGNETLKAYEKFFGKMVIEKRSDLESNTSQRIYKSESKLHQLGYNVVEGKLSETERHNILKYLIDNNIMTDFEIRKDIENAIRIFNGISKYDNAVWKWQTDLVFLSEVQTNTEE